MNFTDITLGEKKGQKQNVREVQEQAKPGGDDTSQNGGSQGKGHTMGTVRREFSEESGIVPYWSRWWLR